MKKTTTTRKTSLINFALYDDVYLTTPATLTKTSKGELFVGKIFSLFNLSILLVLVWSERRISVKGELFLMI